MLNEIEQLIKTLEGDGQIKDTMQRNEVARLIRSLLIVSSRGRVENLYSVWIRCSFLRRQLVGVLEGPAPFDILDNLHKGNLAKQMSKHFSISESHAYTVCNTCIDLFKIEKKSK